MSHRKDLPAAPRSELDHRAINVTGHLLLGVVWLERRIAYLPDQLGALIDMAVPSREIEHRPNERTEDDSDEVRQPHRTPRDRRHGVGPRATSGDIRPGASLLDGRMRHDAVHVQPQSTLLDSHELVDDVGDRRVSR